MREVMGREPCVRDSVLRSVSRCVSTDDVW